MTQMGPWVLEVRDSPKHVLNAGAIFILHIDRASRLVLYKPGVLATHHSHCPEAPIGFGFQWKTRPLH